MGQSWLIIERIENWKADQKSEFSFFGLPDRYRKTASEIRKGDKVFCYVSSGISAFSDIREVRDTGIKRVKAQSREDIYDTNFGYYFTTSPLLVLSREKWVPIGELGSILELTKGRKAWSAVFRTSIRKLTARDASALRRALVRAA
jgi:hypothetical protein